MENEVKLSAAGSYNKRLFVTSRNPKYVTILIQEGSDGDNPTLATITLTKDEVFAFVRKLCANIA